MKKVISILIAAFMLTALLPVSILASSDVEATVSIGEKSYDTLWNALANASENDVIEIGEGTVTVTANEQLRVSVDGVTIKGKGAATVIDTGNFSVSGQAGILVEADNVTISDLTVNCKSDNGNVSAIKFSKIGDGVNEMPLISAGTVSNVTVFCVKGHGLNIHGVSDMTVSGLNVASAGKCGISIANSPAVSVSSSVIYQTGWGSDIGMMYADNVSYANPSVLTLGENNDFGESTVIYSGRPANAPGGADSVLAPAGSGLVFAADNTGAWTLVSESEESVPVAENVSAGFKYISLQQAVDYAEDGETIKLLAETLEIDRMLDITKKSGLILDLNGGTITASADFAGTYENDTHLVNVAESENITLCNGTLKTTAANKHTLNLYVSAGTVIEDLTVDHEFATKGAPIVVNSCDVTVKGNLALVAGSASWYGINIDNKYGAAALTFAAESTVSFENKSEKELVMIFVQDTNEDESVPAPAVTNDSDSIKLEIDENGVINLHKHVASEDKVNVKEPACTEEGYTGDTVCADCGEVIEQGETIPATGHKYENGVCTVCGESDPNYESSVPSTGENGSMILWVSLLALSLGAVAVLAVRAGKKA